MVSQSERDPMMTPTCGSPTRWSLAAYAAAVSDDAGAVIEVCLRELDGSRASLLDEPPSVFDAHMEALASALMRASAEERARFTGSISLRHRMLVGRGLWRIERLAVAERSRERLLMALVVHAAIDGGTDYRDTIVWCALPFLQARKLGVDPVALFDEAATFAGPAVATTLRATGRRTDITVAAFHPAIEDTPDGPRPANLGTDVDFLAQLDRADFGSRTWLIDEVRRREPDLPEAFIGWIEHEPDPDAPSTEP
jgi:hypothetical protein